MAERTPLKDIVCPKCKGAMEDGYIVDSTYGAMVEGEWGQGAHKPHWLKGTEGKRFVTVTFCCVDCGLLESYVRERMKQS